MIFAYIFCIRNYETLSMKQLYIAFIVIVCFVNLLTAQVVRKDTATKFSTPNAAFLGTQKEVTPLAKAEADTNLSYAEEFRRDSYRFQWGVRGGLTRGQLTISEITPVRVNASGTPLLSNGKIIRENLLSNPAYATGFSVGGFARISKGSFYLQPELMYSKKSGKYDVLDNKQQLTRRINATVSVIDVPVLLGIKFRKARAFTGPIASFAYSLGDEFRTNLANYTTASLGQSFLKRPTMNFMSGVGFEFKQIFFDVRFESGISNYTDINLGPDSNPSPFYFSNSLFHFSVGIIRL